MLVMIISMHENEDAIYLHFMNLYIHISLNFDFKESFSYADRRKQAIFRADIVVCIIISTNS